MNKRINNETDYKVKGYSNKWHLIDTYGKYGLLENCLFGDETCCLVIDLTQQIEMLPYKRKNGEAVILPTIMETICETYDDIITALEDENIID